MFISITPSSSFHTSIAIPASKSFLQRYIALSAFSTKENVFHNINLCEDVKAALNCAQQLNAQIEYTNTTLSIKGIPKVKQSEPITLNVSESGLCARMFGIMTPVLYSHIYLTGKGTLLNRPMTSLIDLLQQAGCTVNSNGYLPLYIKKYAQYNSIHIHHPDTSQIVTGLLYAAALSENDISITIQSPTSIPYIQLSIAILNQFGIPVHHNANYTEFFIKGNQTLQAVHTNVEGDWSNAAFFAVAAALSGKVELFNLTKNSIQGDKKILQIIRQAGANVNWKNDVCIIEKNKLFPFEADLTNYPDLFPPLSVLALGIKGTSSLKGVKRLLNKESDRAQALVKEFSKLGGDLDIANDTMIIYGKGYLEGGDVHSHNDHRISMAAAVAAGISKNSVVIENADAVKKSYPQFFEHLLG